MVGDAPDRPYADDRVAQGARDPGTKTSRRRRPASGRSGDKREAIVEAATQSFLGGGYLGTSVDEIATRAGVAKQTVYEHFGGKDQLFTEIVVRTIDEVGRPFYERIVKLEETDEVEGSLLDLARALVGVANEPRLLALRRLVIAEVGRFPNLGRLYYERGPGRTIEALAARFERLDQRRLLRIDDARLAAQQFNWLVLSIPINRAMFDPKLRFAEDELERWAEHAVRMFLATYA
jgi:TetR/AcrR family transcriptional repressor of mexJK operon